MSEVRKFSLSYHPAEDRLAFDSEDADGGTLRLWLTLRLCQGLIRAIPPLLPTAAPQVRAREQQATVQSWEQAAAMASFGHVPGVKPTPRTTTGLVHTVNIQPKPDQLNLGFEYGGGDKIDVGLPHASVRQMLTVMHRLYAAAGWPMDAWPAWIAGPVGAAPSDAVN
jgi:hypothetical protein